MTDQTYDFHVDPADEGHHETGTMLGFWLYLMSDCLLFGILFAVHAVLGQNYAAGPAPSDLFEIELILFSTFMLLFSSITYGFAMIQMQQGSQRGKFFDPVIGQLGRRCTARCGQQQCPFGDQPAHRFTGGSHRDIEFFADPAQCQ